MLSLKGFASFYFLIIYGVCKKRKYCFLFFSINYTASALCFIVVFLSSNFYYQILTDARAAVTVESRLHVTSPDCQCLF